MSDTTTLLPAPGWYGDPLSDSGLRWWDGNTWTEHSQVASAPPTLATPSWGGYGDSEDVVSRAPSFAPSEPSDPVRTSPARDEYVPMGGYGGRSDRTDVVPTKIDWARPAKWSTPAVWAIAFLPWISLLLVAAFVALLLVGSTWYLLLGAALLPLLISIAFAVRDRKRLLSLGHDRRASWAWILLGPLAYLIARGVYAHRATGRGWAPLWMFVVNSVLLAVVAVGGAFALRAAYVPQQVHTIEQTITSDFAQHGIATTVSCPTSGVTLAPGSSLLCTATDAQGVATPLTVRIESGGQFSYTKAAAGAGS